MKIILFFTFLGLALASNSYGGNHGSHGGGYGKKTGYHTEKHYSSVSYGGGNGGQAYHGRYGGRCDRDGFYYRDSGSFVMCSNSNAYVQPCAPGTRNSGFDNYKNGGHYNYRDFCDVNLVDYGYGVRHGYGGPHGNRGGYGQGNNNYGHQSYGHREYGQGNQGYGSHGHSSRGIHGSHGGNRGGRY